MDTSRTERAQRQRFFGDDLFADGQTVRVGGVDTKQLKLGECFRLSSWILNPLIIFDDHVVARIVTAD